MVIMADYFDPNNNGSYNQQNSQYPQYPQYQSNPNGQYDPQQQMYQQQMYQQQMNRGAFGMNQPQYAPGQAYGGAAVTSVNDVLTKSFLFMFLALLVTGIVALFVANSPSFILSFYGNPTLIILVAVAEIGVVIGATFAMKKNNLMLSAILFGVYSVLNGITLSVIFLVYELGSITQVFFIAAAIFGAMAVIGATTKKDLSNIGMICIVGLFGIIIASIVNMFLKSPGMDYVISIIGVIVFVGLTAYDVQKIKKLAASNPGYHPMVLGLYGAMELYLDFINLFLYLLRLLGKAKN